LPGNKEPTQRSDRCVFQNRAESVVLVKHPRPLRRSSEVALLIHSNSQTVELIIRKTGICPDLMTRDTSGPSREKREPFSLCSRKRTRDVVEMEAIKR
jgi:hypothetical protein